MECSPCRLHSRTVELRFYQEPLDVCAEFRRTHFRDPRCENDFYRRMEATFIQERTHAGIPSFLENRKLCALERHQLLFGETEGVLHVL
jgi:hypothetical protein